MSDGACGHCGKSAGKLLRCSRCKATAYCGKECQNASWKQHKRNSCLPFEDRITRIRETVDTAIHEATDREDWRQVLALGKQAEEDLEVAPDDWAMTVVLVNTAQANMNLGNYDAAIAGWERLESYQMPPGMSDATRSSPRAMARDCRWMRGQASISLGGTVNAAIESGDYPALIEAGRRAEEDFAAGFLGKNHDPNDLAASRDRALHVQACGYNSLQDHANSGQAYEKLAAFRKSVKDYKGQAGALVAVGHARAALGDLKGAAVWFTKARDIGAQGGYFDVESEASVGLSGLARKGGEEVVGKDGTAMELAQNGLTAAELLDDDDPNKPGLLGPALYVVIAASDIADASFDETLLHRLAAVEATVAARDTSSASQNIESEVRLLDLWGRRHVAMGRRAEALDAWRKVVELAADLRVAKMVKVIPTSSTLNHTA